MKNKVIMISIGVLAVAGVVTAVVLGGGNGAFYSGSIARLSAGNLSPTSSVTPVVNNIPKPVTAPVLSASSASTTVYIFNSNLKSALALHLNTQNSSLPTTAYVYLNDKLISTNTNVNNAASYSADVCPKEIEDNGKADCFQTFPNSSGNGGYQFDYFTNRENLRTKYGYSFDFNSTFTIKTCIGTACSEVKIKPTNMMFM